MNRQPYHVTGELLATRDARCYVHGLDLSDVEHDRVTVDLVVQARDTAAAASEASWIATQEAGYATWRWASGPVVAAVESEVTPP
jgi:hypothetical protein